MNRLGTVLRLPLFPSGPLNRTRCFSHQQARFSAN